jgi:Uma2 family endonuclease
MRTTTAGPAKEAPRDSWWPPRQGEWTYPDYKRLPENGMRYEVIEGDLCMTPAPSTKHQRTVGAIFFKIREYLDKDPLGEVFLSPIDVLLGELATPVQPDLLVIASKRLAIVKESCIEGAPNLVVEVLSPTNPGHDRNRKFSLYSRARVPEYWIADPEERAIEVFVLRGEAYALAGRFEPGQTLKSELLTGLKVAVSEIFPA